MKNRNFQNAFSLMEMMIVLLIVAIIAAATAPMVTKKMMRTAGSGDSPWVFTGLNNNIAYNMGGANASAIIGASSYSYGDNQPKYPRLVLAAGDSDHPSLVFAKSNGAFGGQINMDADNRIVTMNDQTVGNDSVAFGFGQNITNTPTGIVVIGEGINAQGADTVAIGRAVTASGGSTVTIGRASSTTKAGAVAIGRGATAAGNNSVSIGSSAGVTAAGGQTTGTGSVSVGNLTIATTRSIAIGDQAQALGSNSVAIGGFNNRIGRWTTTRQNDPYSVAIGAGARTSSEHQIVLGTDQETVYIPGNLIVDGTVMLSMQNSTKRGRVGAVFMRESTGQHDIVKFSKADNTLNGHETPVFQTELFSGDRSINIMGQTYYYHQSDRRLKNVGEKYTAGLEELKNLDFYHYTFKADKDNTPLVGVMAQDLQKVFPDAVTKGEDGYLRIRLEDMFYAVINAVKELDVKVSQIVADVTGISSKVEEQQKVIEVQQQKIDELEKANADFEKRLAKLEKKNKKFEE